jgi:hypothetical protein
MGVQPVAHHARLDASPTLIGIDLQHLVHVLGRIDHHARAERLPRKRGAAAARRDRHAETSGDFDGRQRQSASSRGTTTQAGIIW